MEGPVVSAIRIEFERRARARREDDRRGMERQREQRRDKDRQEEHEAKVESDDLLFALATTEEIADFEVDLDRYDALTVEALQEKEEQIARERERLSEMLNDAYTLPDGRKVFKSKDGIHVFDQNGVELKDVDASQIEDWRPKAEELWQVQQKLTDLDTQRQELLKFQTELDDARQRADDGNLSKRELSDLENQLKRNAPSEIAAKIATAGNAPAPQADPSGDTPAIQHMVEAATRGAPQPTDSRPKMR